MSFLYDKSGTRKYLTATEKNMFIVEAKKERPEIVTFCLSLVYTGARVSEILALKPSRIDMDTKVIVLECLKKRRAGVFRAVPVPEDFLSDLAKVHGIKPGSTSLPTSEERLLWTWGRTTAWSYVRRVMIAAGIPDCRAMPKSLRHTFGICATQANVPINILQRWMGHSRISTTAIYSDAVGDEERAFAMRLWHQEGL